MNKKIEFFDSTLRDGAQGQGVSFTVEDKLKIVQALDDFGVDYIEAGNPGSNPKDMEFFKVMKDIKLKTSKLSAFGSTRRPNIVVQEDENIKNLLEAGTEVVVIFGKCWDFHVTDILKTTLEENIKMVKDTISYLKSKNKEVIFDAEHFFDGYKANKEYSLMAIKAAKEAGADTIVLCDTNGGSLPSEVKEICKIVASEVGGKIGIHTHDDMGMAIANSVEALNGGVVQIQGTFVGIGERCGNANLSAIIPTALLKMGLEATCSENISQLTAKARYVAEVLNVQLNDSAPYIGNAAFAHKGGMHIDAVCKMSTSYEHISPESIGNERKFLVSEVSGKSTMLKEIQKVFPSIKKDSIEVQNITDRLKELEYEGYQFEGADGTIELLIRKIIGKYKPFFELNYFKTIGENGLVSGDFNSTALVNIRVDGQIEMTAAEGNGQVNALDKALKKVLQGFYPGVKDVRLVDYKVRVLDSESTTGAKVRVLIESTDGLDAWSTVGVSRDVIQASWIALVDSIEYKLIKDIEKKAKAYF